NTCFWAWPGTRKLCRPWWSIAPCTVRADSGSGPPPCGKKPSHGKTTPVPGSPTWVQIQNDSVGKNLLHGAERQSVSACSRFLHPPGSALRGLPGRGESLHKAAHLPKAVRARSQAETQGGLFGVGSKKDPVFILGVGTNPAHLLEIQRGKSEAHVFRLLPDITNSRFLRPGP